MADLASQYDESVSELLRKQKACKSLNYPVDLSKRFLVTKVQAKIILDTAKYSVPLCNTTHSVTSEIFCSH